MTNCPECGESINILDEMKIGEIIECENCGLYLEIISKEPPVLEIFEEEEK